MLEQNIDVLAWKTILVGVDNGSIDDLFCALLPLKRTTLVYFILET